MAIRPQQPPSGQGSQYLPTSLQALVMDKFEGVNTTTTRPGVPDEQCFWIDGFMPIGPRFLRTIYGVGDSIWDGSQTAPDVPVVTETAITITLTATGQGFFQVPNDWNNSDNTISTIGSGGGGGSSPGNSSTGNTLAAGGGAGGAFAQISNLGLIPGSSVPYFIAKGAVTQQNGSATFFNGATLATSSVGAPGGRGGSGSNRVSNGPGAVASTTGAIGTVVHAGGSGGAGANGGGGGGGGAGGFTGNGLNGGTGVSTAAGGTGGAGDAGHGGSSVGSNAPGHAGTSDNPAGSGGGGAPAGTNCLGTGARAGGGGGAAGNSVNVARTGATGGDGEIKITYTPSGAPPVPPTPSSRIAFFAFGNISATPIMVVVQDDGSVWHVNTDTKAFLQMMTPGTIEAPNQTQVGISQWGSEFMIIVSKQTNGYWLWDGTALFTSGGISPQVTVTAGGSNYSDNPTIAATGGAGGGAAFKATVENGIIIKIVAIKSGTGYLATDHPTITITDSTGSGATGTVSLMPQGIQGTSVETYVGRVWVANGATVFFGSPGSPSDFTTTNGGGNFTSTDSFLRVQYNALIQTNGFLYLIGDSSINYISGVQTSGTPVTTTFTNQNADAETGTAWPNTVDTFGRNILFANAFGAHVSYGAAVTKTSENLDGVYNTLPNFGGLTPSAAKAIVFGKKIWILLLPIVNPISKQAVNQLLMWDGKKWWASLQDVTLNFIQHQEINSVLTAYGTDGASVYPLFQTPTDGFTKVVQSKMWEEPGGLETGKAINRLWGLVQYYSGVSPKLSVTIDNETGAAPLNVDVGPPAMHWRTSNGQTMNWTTTSGATMNWTAFGLTVFPPTAVAQQGVVNGLTVFTNAADMALVSVSIQPEIVQYRG